MQDLILDHISKSYGELKVLEDLSLKLRAGGRYALMGKSGIGKTTLLRLILGLELPNSGVLEPAPGSLRMSVVFQEDRLFPSADAVRNICAATRGLSADAAIDALSAIAPDIDIRTPASDLSGGQRRRVAVLRALLHPSDLLIMDEPFTGLDTASRQKVLGYIDSHIDGRLFIMSTHDRDDALKLGCEIIEL